MKPDNTTKFDFLKIASAATARSPAHYRGISRCRVFLNKLQRPGLQPERQN